MNHFQKVMANRIYNVPSRTKRKQEASPSDIPTFQYTPHLADVRWLRMRARRVQHG